MTQPLCEKKKVTFLIVPADLTGFFGNLLQIILTPDCSRKDSDSNLQQALNLLLTGHKGASLGIPAEFALQQHYANTPVKSTFVS